MHPAVERLLNQNRPITYDRMISFLYNILYIYSVPIGHTAYTKPWATTHYNTKLGAEFPELRDLHSAMSGMVVALLHFPTVSEVPWTPRCSPQNMASFLKLWTQDPTLSPQTNILGRVQSLLDLTLEISPWSRFDEKWLNLMKKWKPMFQKFLHGHDFRYSPQVRRRVTLIIIGDKIKISKWFCHHRFNLMRAFKIYLQIWKWSSRNQDITAWRILVDLENRVKCGN